MAQPQGLQGDLCRSDGGRAQAGTGWRVFHGRSLESGQAHAGTGNAFCSAAGSVERQLRSGATAGGSLPVADAGSPFRITRGRGASPERTTTAEAGTDPRCGRVVGQWPLRRSRCRIPNGAPTGNQGGRRGRTFCCRKEDDQVGETEADPDVRLPQEIRRYRWCVVLRLPAFDQSPPPAGVAHTWL